MPDTDMKSGMYYIHWLGFVWLSIFYDLFYLMFIILYILYSYIDVYTITLLPHNCWNNYRYLLLLYIVDLIIKYVSIDGEIGEGWP